jgi:hypothetical protein
MPAAASHLVNFLVFSPTAVEAFFCFFACCQRFNSSQCEPAFCLICLYVFVSVPVQRESNFDQERGRERGRERDAEGDTHRDRRGRNKAGRQGERKTKRNTHREKESTACSSAVLFLCLRVSLCRTFLSALSLSPSQSLFLSLSLQKCLHMSVSVAKFVTMYGYDVYVCVCLCLCLCLSERRQSVVQSLSPCFVSPSPVSVCVSLCVSLSASFSSSLLIKITLSLSGQGRRQTHKDK